MKAIDDLIQIRILQKGFSVILNKDVVVCRRCIARLCMIKFFPFVAYYNILRYISLNSETSIFFITRGILGSTSGIPALPPYPCIRYEKMT